MNQSVSERPVLHDTRVQDVLDRLHSQADAQRHDPSPKDLSQRYVALDRDKAEFCYLLCRSMGVRNVVEAGTSFGVSTLYLATAVRDNGGGSVIATENEPLKAKRAREHFVHAGLDEYVELREGDLRETLRAIQHPIDFLLIDIWTPMALPALELVEPHLRPGAVVMCDDTVRCADEYRDYCAFVRDPGNGFRSAVLPFSGGFEMSLQTNARETRPRNVPSVEI